MREVWTRRKEGQRSPLRLAMNLLPLWDLENAVIQQKLCRRCLVEAMPNVGHSLVEDHVLWEQCPMGAVFSESCVPHGPCPNQAMSQGSHTLWEPCYGAVFSARLARPEGEAS